MELNGERLIPAPIDQTWAALNDPEVLKGCILGCESLERVGDDGFAAVMAVKVGPVSARFKGNLKLSDVKPPNSYTIHFDGQGGVAGHGKAVGTTGAGIISKNRFRAVSDDDGERLGG